MATRAVYVFGLLVAVCAALNVDLHPSSHANFACVRQTPAREPMAVIATYDSPSSRLYVTIWSPTNSGAVTAVALKSNSNVFRTVNIPAEGVGLTEYSFSLVIGSPESEELTGNTWSLSVTYGQGPAVECPLQYQPNVFIGRASATVAEGADPFASSLMLVEATSSGYDVTVAVTNSEMFERVSFYIVGRQIAHDLITDYPSKQLITVRSIGGSMAVAQVSLPNSGLSLRLLNKGDLSLLGTIAAPSMGLDGKRVLLQIPLLPTVPLKSLGNACGQDDQCASGHCVVGVCCNSPCRGGCFGCNVTTPGLCEAIPAGQPPIAADYCPAAAPCGQTGMCAGDGKCQVTTSGTPCSARVCDVVNNMFRPGATCKQGVCGAASTRWAACPGNLTCQDATSCHAICTADAHCIAGHTCHAESGVCVAIEGYEPTPEERSRSHRGTGTIAEQVNARMAWVLATGVVSMVFAMITGGAYYIYSKRREAGRLYDASPAIRGAAPVIPSNYLPSPSMSKKEFSGGAPRPPAATSRVQTRLLEVSNASDRDSPLPTKRNLPTPASRYSVPVL